MTVYHQVRKFLILDNSINSNADVFDSLIKVKCLITNKEGLLLCSHKSNWPKHLIGKATWLAGCFTPTPFANDNRLVFGNIPNNTINWVVNYDAKTIVIITGFVEHNNFEEVGVELISFNYVEQCLNKQLPKDCLRKIKILDRAMYHNQDIAPYLKIERLSNFMIQDSRYTNGEWFYIQQALYPEINDNEGDLESICRNDGYEAEPNYAIVTKIINGQNIHFSLDSEDNVTQHTDPAFFCVLPQKETEGNKNIWYVDEDCIWENSCSSEDFNFTLNKAIMYSVHRNKYHTMAKTSINLI